MGTGTMNFQSRACADAIAGFSGLRISQRSRLCQAYIQGVIASMSRGIRTPLLRSRSTIVLIWPRGALCARRPSSPRCHTILIEGISKRVLVDAPHGVKSVVARSFMDPVWSAARQSFWAPFTALNSPCLEGGNARNISPGEFSDTGVFVECGQPDSGIPCGVARQ